MPTYYTNKIYAMDPASPPTPNFTLVPAEVRLVDENDDGFIGVGDTINGQPIASSYLGDVIRVNNPGPGGPYTVAGVTFYDVFGNAYFASADGTDLVTTAFESVPNLAPASIPVPVGFLDVTPLPCFTPGTLIDTVDGPRMVEDLQRGDLVRTADHGFQPLLWIERGKFAAVGKHAPVLIRKGAMGNDRDLKVSQQHRMLISGWQVELVSGETEALVAAKYLVNGRDITVEEGGEVEYVHLLFDRHQIVFAEGIPTESYLPSHAVSRADMEVNREVLGLFPDLAAKAAELSRTARPVLKRFEAATLVA